MIAKNNIDLNFGYTCASFTQNISLFNILSLRLIEGDVVVFLDAHCEVDYNWLPPLLAPIHEDRTTLSVPVIDGIKWDDFSITPVYAAGAHSRGLFEWGMFYKVWHVYCAF